MPFTHNMSEWMNFEFDREWLEANIRWKDFGTGVRLGKLAREDKTSLVLYEANSSYWQFLQAFEKPSTVWCQLFCDSNERTAEQNHPHKHRYQKEENVSIPNVTWRNTG